jgi:peptidoglycan/xylan/chitin deacetylase (PgdA/CDA1 family)
MTWLRDSKRAAVCFSVDDVHPAPGAAAALGHVQWLQERHPLLRVTLFTTPDWRTLDPYPSRSVLARIPILRDHLFTVRVHRQGTFRLDRHETFCNLLRGWPGAEIALHGLHHVRTGMSPVLEFAGRSAARCRAMLGEAIELFERASLQLIPGMSPPGWQATPELLTAMREAGLTFVASARDLDTAISPEALAKGSGLTNVLLLHPQRIEPGLLHFPTNFQARSTIERATSILVCGGLLSIKAHLLAESGSYRALDGLTPQYRQYLDRVLCTIEDRFGDEIWWTSIGEIAAGEIASHEAAS